MQEQQTFRKAGGGSFFPAHSTVFTPLPTSNALPSVPMAERETFIDVWRRLGRGFAVRFLPTAYVRHMKARTSIHERGYLGLPFLKCIHARGAFAVAFGIYFTNWWAQEFLENMTPYVDRGSDSLHALEARRLGSLPRSSSPSRYQ